MRIPLPQSLPVEDLAHFPKELDSSPPRKEHFLSKVALVRDTQTGSDAPVVPGSNQLVRTTNFA